MEILIWLLLFFLGLFGGTQTAVDTPPPPVTGGGTFQSYAFIESADVLVLESQPPQYMLTVSGYHPDGCQFPTEITQRRDGDYLFVEIYRTMPAAAACPMMIVPFTETIPLSGDFSQPVTINVNGYILVSPVGG